MATPESKTKSLARDLLARYDIQPASKAGTFKQAAGWYYFAVQGMMSVRGIPDIIGQYHGIFFGLELKAPGKKATGFQKLQIDAISCSGGAVFVVDGPDTLKFFEKWLQKQDLLNRPSLGYLNRMYK